MAELATAYGIKSAVFGADTIKGVTSMTITGGGSAQRSFTDGNTHSDTQWLENINSRLSLTTNRTDVLLDSAISLGDTGVLVLTFGQRQTVGINSTGGLICTTPSGTIFTGKQANYSQLGESSAPMDFLPISSDGTTSPLAMTIES